MSKRVSNKKGRQRKTPARSFRKIGWREKQLRAAQEQQKEETSDESTQSGSPSPKE